jgi:FMN phosphatase YigB (HAD superfamily)
MAQTGTGRLLQYLTRRSIKIVLVPSQLTLTEEESTEGDDMRALRRQLQDVVFDALIVPDPGSHPTPDAALRQAVRVLGRESESPSTALLVSSREEHLRAAKSRGWVTCRIRPKNAPRGNVSTHYMVEAVPDVRQVVDEINGISYSAVLNAR